MTQPERPRPEPLAHKLDRVHRLIRAARRLRDPESAHGARLRERLRGSTLLSDAGVEYALHHCLECEPGPAEIERLCRGVADSPRAHVLLSSNVFTAALRAIAIAAASSPRVEVRASTREPHFVECLRVALDDPSPFELVPALSPGPGEHVWVYGRAETVASLRGELPSGTLIHAHGPGFGAIVIQERALPRERVTESAELVAQDVIAFDQRGCLSPRVVFVEGSREFARYLSVEVAAALGRCQVRIPRGELTQAETADLVRYRDTMTFVTAVERAGRGFVVLDPVEDRAALAPVGRNLHLTLTRDVESALAEHEAHLTTLGICVDTELDRLLGHRFAGARVVPLGRMQRPPLDGPVDRRPGSHPELV